MNYIPLKIHPCYKEYLWGGTRLKREYGKEDAPEVTAESWELSCHPDGVSLVQNGSCAGKGIDAFTGEERVHVWGSDCNSDEFPILVKLIDAEKNLSIQVHPSDETADRASGERGKAEMWYVVDCEPQAFLYYGFSRKIDAGELLQRANDGTICNVLNKVPVSRGDVFYILPGTIHAIGAGIVIAEIQQNSNTTFRVYDYRRRGADGKLRPLHLERAAAVLNYEPVLPQECRINSGVSFPEFSMTEMFSCKYFRSFCIDVHYSARLRCDGRSFHHLLCVEGSGTICVNDRVYPIKTGDSYLMPAALGEYKIEGACRMLLSRV